MGLDFYIDDSSPGFHTMLTSSIHKRIEKNYTVVILSGLEFTTLCLRHNGITMLLIAINYFVTDGEKFDFIVVGSGSAGSIVATRLSEIPDFKVLLIESGGNPPPNSVVSIKLLNGGHLGRSCFVVAIQVHATC